MDGVIDRLLKVVKVLKVAYNPSVNDYSINPLFCSSRANECEGCRDGRLVTPTT